MGEKLQLRKLMIDDFSFIFNLYCEKSQIYWSGHSEAPNEKSLSIWFNKLLSDANTLPYVIEKDNEGIGFCRLVISPDDRYVCNDYSISISECFRGKGYGTKAISLLVKEAGKYEIKYMYGWVLDTNEASKRAFIRNGFQFTGNKKDQYIPLEGKNICMHEYVLDMAHRS